VAKRCFQRGRIRPVHNAVHDMESLLWVLLYICLTREGNKGSRRPELHEEDSDLAVQVRELFEQENAQKKSDCLEAPDEFEQVLLSVHSYFDCLKPLLSKLRYTLYLGHSYESIEHYNIHSIVLALLNETIAKLKRNQDDSVAFEAKQKRRKDWAEQRSVVMQITDVDGQKEGLDHLPNPGGYSPVSKAQSDLSLPAIPNFAPPDSPSPAPKGKRSRRLA
jgi:hypothetical protein